MTKPYNGKGGGNPILLVIAILCTALGLWFLLAPSFEKKYAHTLQNELLAELGAVNASSSASFESETSAVSSEISSESVVANSVVGQEKILLPSSIPSVAASVATDPPIPKTPLENSDNTAIGVLSIEKIALEMPVVCGVKESQLKIAAGLVPETVAVGDVGNAVIAGHRNYDFGDHFNRLGEVILGDVISYSPKDGDTMRFEVFEIIEVLPNDPIAFIQPQNESIITLYTCTPIKTATHRLLVRARKTNETTNITETREVYFEENL